MSLENLAVQLIKTPWPSAHTGFELHVYRFYTLENDKVKNCSV